MSAVPRLFRASLLLLLLLAAAQPSPSASSSIFVSEPGLCYRIPTMVQTPSGALLAFAEARAGPSCSDDDPNGHNLVMKSSSDGGASWGAEVTVVGDAANLGPGGVGYTNPVPTVVRLPGGGHRILFHYATLNNPCLTKHGQTLQRWSDDDGASWSSETDISGYLPAALPGALPGPAAGVQTASGRIICCAWGNHNSAPPPGMCFPKNYSSGFSSFVYYSDDLGATYTALPILTTPASTVNECTIALTADGSLLVLLRQVGGPFMRTLYAPDLSSHSPLVPLEDLPTPVCEGSLAARGAAVYFSNPSSATQRANMTVHRSTDSGASWPAARVYLPGAGGYSAMLALAGSADLAIAYEVASTKGINFTRLAAF